MKKQRSERLKHGARWLYK